LQNTGRGGYDIVLTNKNTSHMDFSDLSVLGAHDATELHAKKAFPPVVEAYTRAFFDEKLSGIPEPLIDSAAASGLVLSAEHYQSVTAPCRK
jgi:hypothetical protein